jgi:hypothetical protein
MKIRYSKRNDTTHDHAHPASNLITAGHERDQLL